MPERTADLRRLTELVDALGLDQPHLAVVGHACPWRTDLVAVLSERRPAAMVTAHERVPEMADLTVGLELSASEAAFQVLKQEWEASGRKARGEPLGTWTAAEADAEKAAREDEASLEVVRATDVVFVPVSGVRPPRRLRFTWGDPAEPLWDFGNAYLGELGGLLPLSPELRARLQGWQPDLAGPRPGNMLVELRRALGPDFQVDA